METQLSQSRELALQSTTYSLGLTVKAPPSSNKLEGTCHGSDSDAGTEDTFDGVDPVIQKNTTNNVYNGSQKLSAARPPVPTQVVEELLRIKSADDHRAMPKKIGYKVRVPLKSRIQRNPNWLMMSISPVKPRTLLCIHRGRTRGLTVRSGGVTPTRWVPHILLQ